MSLSFRSSTIVAAALLLAAASTREAAAQSYVVPSVELSSEYHTNRELTAVPGQADPTTGYIATAQALIGKRTPRSQTELRPRVRFQEYPDRNGVDPVDMFLDLQSTYSTLRSNYSLLASASRQDTFNAEFGAAGIDTSGPETPASYGDTGIVFIGNTRTEFNLEPSMDREISERTNLGLTVGYDKVHYQDTATDTREDYSNISLQTLLKHQYRPLTQFEIGPYVSRFKSAEGTNRTRSAGLTLGWNHEVSEISHTEIKTSMERMKINDPTFSSTEQTQTTWSAEFKGYRKGRVSRLDYGVGRYLAASGIGSKVRRDELRLQYVRQLSPRFDYRGAIRAGTEQRLGFTDNARDRNYVRSELFVRWFMTRTMYVSAGYRYSWQKYKIFANDADDNAALVVFGFSGFDVRRSAVRGPR